MKLQATLEDPTGRKYASPPPKKKNVGWEKWERSVKCIRISVRNCLWYKSMRIVFISQTCLLYSASVCLCVCVRACAFGVGRWAIWLHPTQMLQWYWRVGQVFLLSNIEEQEINSFFPSAVSPLKSCAILVGTMIFDTGLPWPVTKVVFSSLHLSLPFIHLLSLRYAFKPAVLKSFYELLLKVALCHVF